MSYQESNTFGSLSSAPDGSIVEHIFNYIVQIISDFDAKTDENENSITNRLCIMLNKCKPAEYSYFFHHQNIENESENTSTDFAVFVMCSSTNINTNSNDKRDVALLKFEAKRLTITLSKKREREYVIGEYDNGKQIRNSGGIERFKNERHGKDMNVACLVGYVQNESISFWHEKVNKWINEEINNPHDNSLIWCEKDKLNTIISGSKTSTFSSTINRISGSNMLLRHIWINLT